MQGMEVRGHFFDLYMRDIDYDQFCKDLSAWAKEREYVFEGSMGTKQIELCGKSALKRGKV
jgi:hypothetical protein